MEVLIILVPILMTIAFVTISERKVMAAMQRRCGPNAVGIWGILQPYFFKQVVIIIINVIYNIIK